MPLKIELKPKERIIVGGALITNDNERIRFYVDGDVPILREKLIMKEQDANTPCKRLYYIVLHMYLQSDSKKLQDLFLSSVKDLHFAAPSLAHEVNEVVKKILGAKYYEALKAADKLIKKEEALFGEVFDFSQEIEK